MRKNEASNGLGTISGVSRKLQVHRRLVREALSSAVPAERKPQERKLRKLQAGSAAIDAILMADRQAPAKQRHTARRIWQRLCAELPGFSGSERSVRGYVRRRRQQLGLVGREVFVPQSYAWGVEAQVDFHEPCQSSDFMLNFAFASSTLKLTTRLPFAFCSAIGPDA
jgi:hypothetical protein